MTSQERCTFGKGEFLATFRYRSDSVASAAGRNLVDVAI